MKSFSSKRLLKTEDASMTPVRQRQEENETGKTQCKRVAFQEKMLSELMTDCKKQIGDI